MSLQTLLLLLAEALGIGFALLVLFTVFTYVGLLWKRLRLVLSLRSLAKRSCGTITWLRNPFLSVFQGQRGSDFELKTPKIRYRVALLSAHHPLREHSFASPTELYTYRRLRLLGVAGGRVRSRINVFNFGVSISKLSIDLESETDDRAEKVLLFHPVSRDVTVVRKTKKVHVGNGDELFCSYRLMTLSAFCEEAERGEVYRRRKDAWDAE
ncbi:MAG: hypothetical protein IKC69_05415 [Clostridia bacterium]|nr:hypothetical protein [Clostridia bacterium]